MRRLAALLAASILMAAAPAAATATSARCHIDVTPAAGAPTDVYRVTATNFPGDPDLFAEVRIDVRRLGTRTGSVFFLFLLPGTTDFYLDINQPAPGEPIEPMEPGRYLVVAEAAHSHSCLATDRFVVG